MPPEKKSENRGQKSSPQRHREHRAEEDREEFRQDQQDEQYGSNPA
jgi:hypothetical protein